MGQGLAARDITELIRRAEVRGQGWQSGSQRGRVEISQRIDRPKRQHCGARDAETKKVASRQFPVGRKKIINFPIQRVQRVSLAERGTQGRRERSGRAKRREKSCWPSNKAKGGWRFVLSCAM